MSFSRVVHRSLLATAVVVAAGAVGPAGAMARPVEQYHGKVVTLAHEASGRAAVVRDGRRRLLTLSRSFRIDPGPRVRVYLVAGRVRGDGDVKRFVDLGRLKGSRGSQQYRIPAGTNVARYRTVVFWCVPFSQAMAKAELRRS
ncbi:DM13 domain-containing protein [Paraconexibacter sp.]|uniref:DM13 domain-containing protein n=1 Tax=Paraconexibacter sp. TaxID=2949640 RepID=UPI00356A3895